MLKTLLPERKWDAGAVTRRARLVSAGMLLALGPQPIRHQTAVAEISPLLKYVRWDQFSVAFDPWAGVGTIPRVLCEAYPHLSAHGNELDPRCKAYSTLDALQPGNWALWRQDLQYDVVVCSPYFPALDLAVPLMMEFAPVLFVHVRVDWLFSSSVQRQEWLGRLDAAGRTVIIVNLPRGNSGSLSCCWLGIFDTPALRARYMVQDRPLIWW